MTVEVRLRREAEQELLDAAHWYEQKREDLGRQFLSEVQLAMEWLAEHPRSAPVVFRGVRRMLVRRFPFGIFYKVEDSRIIVVAVMHASRHPHRWKSRA